MAFPEQTKKREALFCSPLHVQDLILWRVGYRHGNLARIGVERRDELLEPLRIGITQAQREMT